jgi:AraC-like DNA-binding protein
VADNVAQQTLDAQNLERALKLRVRGAHWNEIAQQCGFTSPAAALAAVGRAMEEATQRATESADQLRDTANLQLDALLGEAWDMIDERAPDVYDADGNPVSTDDRAVRLRAVDEARRLIESKTKLNGVKPPEQDPDRDQSGIRIVGVMIEDII